MSSRRAVLRWTWRMLRREWRDQLVVFALIAAAVTLSIGGALLAYHAAPPSEAIDSGVSFTIETSEEDEARVLAQLDNVGAIERGSAELSGSTFSLDTRALDETNPVLHPLIDLISGRLPSGPAEVAITDEAARLAAVDVGGEIELDGIQLTIVGEVENPTDLDDEFVLLDHADPAPLPTETLYVLEGSISDLQSISFDGGLGVSETTPPRTITKVLANVVMAMAMILIGLMASASFSVVARRRVRQYGLLGAIGANERQLRGTAAMNGFILGAIAAGFGAALGIFSARLLLPHLEEAVGHRLSFSVPTAIWLPTVAIAILISTVAAWWPARAVAAQPIVEALAARRPLTRPVHRTSVLGIVFVVLGYLLLGYAAREQSTFLAVSGLALAIAGVLLTTPAAVSVIGRISGGLALPLRIAGRDLARYQGRSAAALGAIVLALAVPIGIGVVTSAIDGDEADDPPNVSEDTAIVWNPQVDNQDGTLNVPVDFDASAGAAVADRIADANPELIVTPIQIPISRDAITFQNDDGVPSRFGHAALTPLDCGTEINGATWSYGTADGEVCFRGNSLWVATPELLDLWDLDLAGVNQGNAVITRVEADISLPNDPPAPGGGPEVLQATAIVADIPDYGSFPTMLATRDALGPGFDAATIGWILSADKALDPPLIAELRDAMSAGTRLETTATPTAATGLRALAAVIGALVGLSILGATVTLIRSESADDDRVLSVLGAATLTRRAIAGSTAGLLAFAGAVLALPLGYVALIVARSTTEGLPFAVPWSTILIVFVAFPMVAAGLTALFSRTEQEHIRRIT